MHIDTGPVLLHWKLDSISAPQRLVAPQTFWLMRLWERSRCSVTKVHLRVCCFGLFVLCCVACRGDVVLWGTGKRRGQPHHKARDGEEVHIQQEPEVPHLGDTRHIQRHGVSSGQGLYLPGSWWPLPVMQSVLCFICCVVCVLRMHSVKNHNYSVGTVFCSIVFCPNQQENC